MSGLPVISVIALLAASDLDEFRVKREAVFEFAQKPVVTRQGDKITIAFETKGFCNVTVAIEDGTGRIVRHLVSGVLGANAPEPFQRNSRKQSVIWDGKNDKGEYVDDQDRHTVRVSLGLKPQFERTLFWCPKKRMATATPLFQATEEGVYVFDGSILDQLRLFDHEGNYLRTVYPFPAGALDQVLGIERRVFPQDGKEWPVKQGFHQGALLTAGSSADPDNKGEDLYAAMSMAAHKGRLALAMRYLNRLTAEGTSGGLKLTGPRLGIAVKGGQYGPAYDGDQVIGPSSAAFSPDGKWLYLTGYFWMSNTNATGGHGVEHCVHGVQKLAFEQDAAPQVFAGVMKEDEGQGSDNAHFTVPSSVACDTAGRVYVADFMNDRVQVFSAQGQFLKTIPSIKPAKVLVNPKNGEIWIFSWGVPGVAPNIARPKDFDPYAIQPTWARHGSFDHPDRQMAGLLPLPKQNTWGVFFLKGQPYDVAMDFWTDPPTLWVGSAMKIATRATVAALGLGGYGAGLAEDPWIGSSTALYTLKDGRLTLKQSFGKEVLTQVARVKPPDFGRQRLYANPKTGKLYLGEDLRYGKAFKQLLEMDPVTGAIRPVELPFDSEDLCFDWDGLAYLRTDKLVARYDPVTWREVTWDYGEEREHVTFIGHSAYREAPVASGLATPGMRPVCWNMGGMGISPKGQLAVSCANSYASPPQREWRIVGLMPAAGAVKPYTPTLYPGRAKWQEIHIWDPHGRLIREDAVPGLHILHGTEIDNEGNLYVMAAANRVIDGKPYFNEMAGTLMKFKSNPKKPKVLSTSPGWGIPLAESERPTRAPDLVNAKIGAAWVEGAEWFYGGLGFGGFNTSRAGGGCDCWNSKFTLDYYARSFVPETDHYSVAVLDTEGNLILRIGKYGNVDDGKPLIPDGGPKNPRSIGGDEVALCHAAFLGTHTDRRVFIADAGNARILSVKLDYYATEKIALKDVRETRP